MVWGWFRVWRDPHSRGRWLAHTDTEALLARFGDGMVVLNRGELLAALRDACCDVQVRTSAEVRTVDADGTVTIGAPGDAGNPFAAMW